MRSNIKLSKKIDLLSEMEGDSLFQILSYSDDINNGNLLSQVRIVLDNSSIRIQDNSLGHMIGLIDRNDSIVEYKGIKKILFNSSLSADQSTKSMIEGYGEVFLRSSYGNFTLIELIDEEIIIKDDIFWACDNEITIKAINYHEGYINELKLKGSGIVCLKLPVKENRIIRQKLFKDKIFTNINSVILRTERIKVYKQAVKRDISDTQVYEEEMIIYEGIGEIWIL